jgi:Flp pilus assembly protein TadG
MTKPHEARRGVNCVEFALVAPILLFLVFSTIELWRVNVMIHMADQAAYEAARTMMVPGMTVEDGIAEAEAVMAIASARDVSVQVDPPVVDDETPQVTVTVVLPLSSNCWVTPRVFNFPEVSSSITLNRELIVD